MVRGILFVIVLAFCIAGLWKFFSHLSGGEKWNVIKKISFALTVLLVAIGLTWLMVFAF